MAALRESRGLGLYREATLVLLALSGCSGSPAPAPPPTAVVHTGTVVMPVTSTPPPGSNPRATEGLAAAAPVAAALDAEPVAPNSPSPIMPPYVRVGLATDLTEFTLPCCESELLAEFDDRVAAVTKPVHVVASATTSTGIYRLQVMALKDEGQAHGLAEQLSRISGEPADAVFDAGSDLYRVRVGRYDSREAVEQARTGFHRYGVDKAWIVHEGGGVEDPAFVITQGQRQGRISGRWLAFRSTGDGIRVEGRRYRGRILLYVNDRGSLNLVNEIALDDYLRGVLPQEMGPELYPELEALKALAVAARTYTLRNLGEFESEGYDICATPRCQVYGGMEVEHPLSDQAIADTAGLVVLYEGETADTLYSSTCGGHTENVEVVFPLKREPYLRGVPCIEAGSVELGMRPAGSAPPLATSIMDRVLPRPRTVTDEQALAQRLDQLAELAELPAMGDRLGSLDRRELRRFIASQFDLALDARLFETPEDLHQLLEDPPEDWGDEDLRLAAFFASGATLPPEAAPTDEEVDEVLLGLAQSLGVVQRERVSYRSKKESSESGPGATGGVVPTLLVARRSGAVEELRLTEPVVTYRWEGDRRPTGSLDLAAGDPLSLFVFRDQVLAVVQEVDSIMTPVGHSHPQPNWTRFRSHEELALSVQARYPGFVVTDLEVVSRGVSGRVGKLRLLGEKQDDLLVEGLAVRWTLDLPDTLFTVQRLTAPSARPGWLFRGRGRGHGVGMCQVGAYAMAARGHDFLEILHHYYTGIEVGRLVPADRGSSVVSSR